MEANAFVEGAEQEELPEMSERPLLSGCRGSWVTGFDVESMSRQRF